MFDRRTAATSFSALTSCWMRIWNHGFWKSIYHQGDTHTHTHLHTHNHSHMHNHIHKCSVFQLLCFCSLHSNTALDVSIKGQMVKDLLNLAGFHLPRKEDVIASCGSASSGANRYRGMWCMSLFNCGGGKKEKTQLVIPKLKAGKNVLSLK